MATAITNRAAAGLQLEVRLAMLAARAITGLADLAENQNAWNGDLEEDIQAGIEFCHAIKLIVKVPNSGSPYLARPATQAGRSEPVSPIEEEVDAIEEFLRSILETQTGAPARELLTAIDFFVRATGSRQLAQRK